MVEMLKRKTLNALFPRDTHPELPLDPDAERPGQYKFPLHFMPGLQLVVFVGGCLGTLTRYEIEKGLPTASGKIPYGTLLTNLSGAFVLGLLLESLARHGEDRGKRQLVRLGFGTGFMGAYTTYSTFAVEAGTLLRGDHISAATLYAALSVVGGLICSALGIQLAAAYHRKEDAY
ncbi:MAG TPA: fluoride efflux transporter CrcB [Candidatus Saccharimonadales bacterium]